MSQVRDGWSTTGTGGADQGTVRRANLSLVLRSLREGGARSRARLAADLGLNKATVSSLVTELRERGLVREGSAERGAVGRPGTIVEIDGAGAYGLGAEINVHHVSTRAVDLAGAVVSERRTSVDTRGLEPDEVVDRLVGAGPRHAGRPGRARRGPGRRRSWEWPAWSTTTAAPSRSRPTSGGRTSRWPACCAPGSATPTTSSRWTTRPTSPPSPRPSPATPSAATSSSSTARSASVAASSPTAGRSPDGAATPASSATWSSTATATGAAAVARGAGRPSSVSATCIDLAAAGEDDLLRSPVLDLEGKVEEISRRAAAGDERTLAALSEVGRWVGIGAAILTNVLNPGMIVLSRLPRRDR